MKKLMINHIYVDEIDTIDQYNNGHLLTLEQTNTEIRLFFFFYKIFFVTLNFI